MIYETIATFLAWNRRKWHNGILCSIFTFSIQKCSHRKRPLLFFTEIAFPLLADLFLSRQTVSKLMPFDFSSSCPGMNSFTFSCFFFFAFLCQHNCTYLFFSGIRPRNRILCKRRARIRVVRISSQNLPPKTSRAVRERIGKISISHL